MNLPLPVNSWSSHSKIIEEKTAELVEQNYQEAV